MDIEILPEQAEKLKSWAAQRDAILSEISVLRTAKEKIEKDNENLTASFTDIENRKLEIQGRIEELKIKEAELPLLISKEVAHLESRKSSLEAVIENLSKIIPVLTEQKESLEKDVSFALSTFNTVKDETLLLDKVVDRVTQVSAENTKKIDDLVVGLSKSLEEIIEVNKKNVFETNIVIEKLPAMLMELQKRGLIKHRQAIIKNNP